jgi:hypothetical protein
MEEAPPGDRDPPPLAERRPARRQRRLGAAIGRRRVDPPRLAPGLGPLRRPRPWPVVFGAAAEAEQPAPAARGEGLAERHGQVEPVGILGCGPEAARRHLPGGMHQDGRPDVAQQGPRRPVVAQIRRMPDRIAQAGPACDGMQLEPPRGERREHLPPDEAGGAGQQQPLSHDRAQGRAQGLASRRRARRSPPARRARRCRWPDRPSAGRARPPAHAARRSGIPASIPRSG